MPLRKPSGKRKATGTGTTDGTGYFTVTGLSFTPSVVIFRMQDKSFSYSTIQFMHEANQPNTENAIGIAYAGSAVNGTWGGRLSSIANGFGGNVNGYGNNKNFTYTAYE